MAIFFKLRRFIYIAMMSVVNFMMTIVPISFGRILILKILGVKIGQGVTIGRGVRLDFPWRLSIGDNCYIGSFVYLDCRGGFITINKGSDISEGALIYTLSHDIQSADLSEKCGDVVVGERVWICARAIVLPGTRVGMGSVLSANSVFSGAAPEFTLLIGNPARNVKKLNVTRASRVRNWR